MTDTKEEGVIVRATVHLPGKIVPGGLYLVNPESEYIKERLADQSLVLVDPPPEPEIEGEELLATILPLDDPSYLLNSRPDEIVGVEPALDQGGEG